MLWGTLKQPFPIQVSQITWTYCNLKQLMCLCYTNNQMKKRLGMDFIVRKVKGQWCQNIANELQEQYLPVQSP